MNFSEVVLTIGVVLTFKVVISEVVLTIEVVLTFERAYNRARTVFTFIFSLAFSRIFVSLLKSCMNIVYVKHC